jgi:hypothetical protein
VQISLSFATLQKTKILEPLQNTKFISFQQKILSNKSKQFFSLSNEMGTRQDISFDEYLNLVHIDEQTYIGVLHS